MSFSGLLPGQGVPVAVAGIGLAAWFGLLGLVALATRSPQPAARAARRPEPARRPSRLRSSTSLTGGWKLCEEAAAATVLDLAARRVVSVEEIGPELSLVRLGRSEPTGLNPTSRWCSTTCAGSPPRRRRRHRRAGRGQPAA